MEHILQYEDFIKKYKIALKLKWSRENLAEILGIIPDTIRRKVGKINDAIGIRLPPLPLDAAPLTAEMRTQFHSLYGESDSTIVETNGSVRTYLITAAQNATPIHSGFFDSCINYCEHNNAKFIVIPYRYKNPTSLWSQGDADHEWWSAKLTNYLVDQKIKICNNLMVLGNIKIQPTQTVPLSGLEGFSGTDSAIVAHPKIQLRSIPTLGTMPKLLMTTGTVTVPNYTDSKAGHKANFHHSLSAIVVEVQEDETFHVRHVHGVGKSGAFYDLDAHYTPSGVTHGHSIEALITGDTHAEFIDEIVENVTYHDKDSIVESLKPKKIFLHDVLDFYARNHHHVGNDLISFGKHKNGRNNVQDGLQEAADFIDRISHSNVEIVIVKSNHDEAFDRWLRESEPRADPENADFFYYMKYHQLKSVRMTGTGFDSFDPFKFWCLHPENGMGLKHVDTTRFLKRDESIKISNIELGFHGDVGINGARGDIRSLAKLSNKMIIGHSHTPGIYEGCYQVGLSARVNLEYRRGPSSWMQTHCIVYPDGKRTLINIINGHWKHSCSAKKRINS